MKKLSLLMMLFALLLTACSDSDNENGVNGKETIKMPSGQQLNQNVYADEEKGTSNIAFTTTAPWNSSIKEIATKSSTNESWVNINPNHGDIAGDYTIELILQPNYTGEKRSATTTIKCNGQDMDITVTQDAVTKDGEKPIEEKYNLGFIVLSEDGKLFTANEKGDISKTITMLEDSCELYLVNYNEDAKDVYIHRYYDYNLLGKISEVFAYNIETNTKTTLIKDLPSYDKILVSADGNYVAYEKIGGNKSGSVIVSQSIKDNKETIIYDGEEIDGLGTISANGSIVTIDTYSGKVHIIEDATSKYTFENSSNGVRALLSPNNRELLLENRNNGLSELSLCNLDGSEKIIIKNGDSDIESIFWSADNKYVYYEEYPSDNKLYKIDTRTKNIDVINLNWGSSFDVLSFKVKL